LGDEVKQLGEPALQALNNYLMSHSGPEKSSPANIHDVVQIIKHESNLNAVAGAFLAFRELTGVTVKMFDFGAVQHGVRIISPSVKRHDPKKRK
jgi:hypothetical protein